MQKDKVDDLLTYQAYVDNYRRRTELRKINFQQRQQDIFGGQRRSAVMKTITKFIGKLKMEGKNFQALLAQLDTLNMSKYVEQISNIIATSINQKQIVFYTQIATKLNTSYENVPSIMIKDIVKNFNIQVESQQDNKPKIKSLFLYATELFVCGFSFSFKQILEMIKKVFKSGKTKKNISHSDTESKLFIYCYSSTIFSTFLAHFSEVFTKRQSQNVSHWRNLGKQVFKYQQVLPMKAKDQLTTFFSKYVVQCFSLLKDVSQLIKKYESQLFECLRLDGEFNKQSEKNYVEVVERFMIAKKHLKHIASSISEPTDFTQLDIKITSIPQIMARYIDKSQNAIIFQDQFQKEIYEGIPELVTSQEKNITDDQYKQFKQLLDNCKNVNDCNEIAKAFNNINNKKNRKQLAKDILQYRKQYHLVTPYLCRVIAIVNTHFKDIGEVVNDLIFSEYDKIKENQSFTFVLNDKKSRIMKYICEFTKFKVVEVQKMMNCIQNLIENLNGFNIELIVSVLENVGRFLHLYQASANRFTFLMKKYENVIKKKSLPLLTTTQLINSINLLKPRKQIEKLNEKQKTAEEVKAQKIMDICVIDEIDELMNQIDDIIKTQPGFQAIKIAFLKKIETCDFMNNYNYAYLLDQLKLPKLSNFVVDRTIQNLMLYMLNSENQKTILWSKFFAQLYNYKLLQRSLLFSTMESLLKITNNEIGVIHACCSIFEATNGCLDSKKVHKKNQIFQLLVKFKSYLLKCKYIPMLEEYQVIQIFDRYEQNLSEIDKKVLDQFMEQIEKKMKTEGKELSYSEELDRYLSKRNLKKFQPKVEFKDTRGQVESPEKTKQQDNSSFVQQVKLFDKELTNIMQEHRKQYSSRMAKQVNIEKIFDKKKQKKKDGPCITVIGRSGNKFIRKDISKVEEKKAQ